MKKRNFQNVISMSLGAHKKLVLHKYLEMGLSAGQPRVLVYLLRNDGCLHKDIADFCGIEPSSVTNCINNLERKGYVTRELKPENRREIRLHLTEKGIVMARKVLLRFEEFDGICMQGFTEEEKDMLENLLKKLYRNMLGCDMPEYWTSDGFYEKMIFTPEEQAEKG